VTRYFAWSPQETNDALLRRAREIERRYHLAWWDCTVVAAALMQDCLVLLSDELPEGTVFGALAVRSPFSAIIGEPPAEYLPTASSAPAMPAPGDRRDSLASR
jgi:hypothetical protein